MSQVIARATIAPIASCPSSTRSPKTLCPTPCKSLDISRLEPRAHREESAEDPDAQPARREERSQDEGERGGVARPLRAEAFAEPEDAEAREDRADAELQPVLRHHREGPAKRDRERDHDEAGYRCADDRRRERGPAARAERDDDEGDLGPLEKHRLVRDERADAVERAWVRSLGPERRDLPLIDQLFIVQRDDPREPQDGLPEPPQSKEEQQGPDEELERVLRNDGHERGAER